MSKIKIKKGDVVRIISGASRGKEGKVLEILVDAEKALVEGQNMVSRHTKPNTKNPQGGIIKKEAPIHISNLLVIDGKGNPTRIGRRVENGKIIRFSKKSGEVIK
jgi:large subunit ribosomal protein L24